MGELESLWLKNEKFKEKHINQVISWVSDLDSEKRKEEIRKLFSIIPISQIEKYVSECIKDKFEDNGYIFQDLVNELGRRLGYEVIFGRYKGVKGENGFDGLWKCKDEHSFVVESKITDSFTVNLSVLNKYRQDLIKEGRILENKSSIILVLGRKDTNTMPELIRGSKYKWIMSEIGVDSLIDLVKQKSENIDNETLDKQILDVLRMEENVDTDKLVKVVFPKKNKYNISNILNKPLKLSENKHQKRESVKFYEQCVNKIEKSKNIKLHKKEGNTKVLYEDKSKGIGVIIINSKIRKTTNYDKYWFAYHRRYYNYVSEYDQKYIAFGCGSEDNILLVPSKLIEENIGKMNKTNNNGRIHWHVFIIHRDGKFLLNIPLDDRKWIDITKYYI